MDDVSSEFSCGSVLPDSVRWIDSFQEIWLIEDARSNPGICFRTTLLLPETQFEERRMAQ